MNDFEKRLNDKVREAAMKHGAVPAVRLREGANWSKEYFEHKYIQQDIEFPKLVHEIAAQKSTIDKLEAEKRETLKNCMDRIDDKNAAIAELEAEVDKIKKVHIERLLQLETALSDNEDNKKTIAKLEARLKFKATVIEEQRDTFVKQRRTIAALVKVLGNHNQWHLDIGVVKMAGGLNDEEFELDLSAEYCDSGLYEDTDKALALAKEGK